MKLFGFQAKIKKLCNCIQFSNSHEIKQIFFAISHYLLKAVGFLTDLKAYLISNITCNNKNENIVAMLQVIF